MSECISALFGAIVGGLIAVWAAILAVRRTEYYRLCGHLKLALRNCLSRLESGVRHPAIVVEDSTVDDLVADLMPTFPVLRCRAFNKAWREYRYDKSHNELSVPSEYTTMGNLNAKQLIEFRIHGILSLLK
jgi:hypothetical protein